MKYSLRSELLLADMDVSRCILVLDTSIFMTSNLERREYQFRGAVLCFLPLGIFQFVHEFAHVNS